MVVASDSSGWQVLRCLASRLALVLVLAVPWAGDVRDEGDGDLEVTVLQYFGGVPTSTEEEPRSFPCVSELRATFSKNGGTRGSTGA